MKLFSGEIFPEIKINEDEQQHIVKVLRMKPGEEIYLTDGLGNLARGNLVAEGRKLGLELKELRQNIAPFSPALHIAIAPTKNIDRIEFFVEKATEMGIAEITFLSTEKTERRNLNLDKLIKQSVAASKQSLRFHFPKINALTKVQDFIKTANLGHTFVCHCNENLERIGLHSIPSEKASGYGLVFLIGPEGDFSDREIRMLADHGVKAVSLGPQRLRTETAGVFVAAWNYSNMF